MSIGNLITRRLRLGKRPARLDARNIRLEKYLSPSRLPTPPETLDYTKAVDASGKPWGMYANDQIGDCGPAGAGHQIMAWTANSGMAATPPNPAGPFVPLEEDIIKFYSLVSGYDPNQTNPQTGENPTDTGVDLTAMYQAWQQTGVAGRKIAAYGTLTPSSPNFDTLLCSCMNLFGSAGMGIQLPVAYQPEQLQRLGLTDWLAPSNHHLFGIWQPGSWGGHYVPLMGYTATRLKLITWGAEQLMSYNALHTYCDEIKVPLSPDWFNGTLSVSGFDVAALRNDLSQIR